MADTDSGATRTDAQAAPRKGINLLGLIALVVSSSIGSGVFALSTDISRAAAPGAAILTWLITGIGFMALATTFGRLSLERPDLNDIVAYAKEGFGSFTGFVSGWGYWLSIWIGNVAFGVMFVTAIGYFVPAFSGALAIPGVVLISAINWLIVWLVNRGVEEASIVNTVVMICKLVPIFAFIVTMIAVFKFDVFTADFWGNLANNMGEESAPGSLGTQVVNCLMVMMWVFVGMEGASVLGHRAQRARDVSRATMIGTTALVVIYIAASILPYGYMTRAELMALDAPSMPYIFQSVVGPWGGAFISLGLIISIFGSWLSYTILASEAMRGMADMELLPAAFGKLNRHGAPTACLVTTGIMIQILAVVMLFSEAAYQFAYSLCTASIIISWSLAAAYMVRYSRTTRQKGWRTSTALALFACAFLVAAVLLAGVDLLLLCCIAYVPGIVFYLIARREDANGEPFSVRDRIVCAGIVLLAVLACLLLATGTITI